MHVLRTLISEIPKDFKVDFLYREEENNFIFHYFKFYLNIPTYIIGKAIKP